MKKTTSVIFFILLLSVMALIDILALREVPDQQQLQNLRDVLFILAFLSLIPTIRHSKLVASKEVVGWLGELFLGLLGLVFALLVAKFLIRVSVNGEVYADRAIYTQPMQIYFYAFVTTVMAVGVGIFLLLVLRQLIFCKRKRNTARNFRWLMILLFIQLIYVHFADKNFFMGAQDFQESSTVGWVILFLLVIFMIVNSLRTAWVNFLNKKQKLACMWGGLVLIPATFTLLLKFRDAGIINSFSPISSTFLYMTSLFLLIYIAVSFIKVLLHLPTAGIFDKKIKEVASLHELSRAVSSVFDQDKLVATITNLTSDVTECDFCWLELITSHDNKLTVVSYQNLSPAEIERVSEYREGSISTWVLANQESVFISVASKDSRTQFLRKWKRRSVGSLLAVPLIFSRDVKGVLVAGKGEEYGFEDDDRSMLEAFADQAAVALENARLFKESIEKSRFEEELKIAHDAQMKLLPTEMPVFDGLQLDAICMTANEVGGDYYDFFQLDGNKIGLVIGDVSGKGPSAAFYMAEIKGIFESFSKIYNSPQQLLQKVNETVFGTVDRKTFISVIYAVIDVSKRKVTFGRAGHCPLLFYDAKKGTASYLQPGGIGLGLDVGIIFDKTLEEESIRMKSGDVLLFFTDGVVEARNIENEEFQEDRLRYALEKKVNESATIIKKELVSTIDEFVGAQNRHDDLTFVVLKAE